MECAIEPEKGMFMKIVGPMLERLQRAPMGTKILSKLRQIFPALKVKEEPKKQKHNFKGRNPKGKVFN